MAILESLKRFATGKTSAERKKELDFNRMIRREANEAAMVVRKKQAIKCAEEIQEDLVENPLVINKSKIILRIGICQGPVMESKIKIQGKELIDYLGNTVNTASRMESKVSKEGGFAFASLSKEDEYLDELLRDYKSRKFVLVSGFGVFVYITCRDDILVSPIALYTIYPFIVNIFNSPN